MDRGLGRGFSSCFHFLFQRVQVFPQFLLDSYLVNSKKLEPLCISGVNVN